MAAEPYKAEVTLEHEQVRVSSVELAPGHKTPEHSHRYGYVVHPRSATKLVKTHFQDGQPIKTEELEHKPGEPYFVAASEDGITFSVENVGSGPMLCDKTMIKSS